MSGDELQRLVNFEVRGGLSYVAESIIIFQMYSDKSVGTQTFGTSVAVSELAKVVGSIAECLEHPGKEEGK